MYTLTISKTNIRRLTANNFEVDVTYTIMSQIIIKEVGKVTVPLVMTDERSVFKSALNVALRNKLDIFLELEAAKSIPWMDKVLKEVEENGNKKLNKLDAVANPNRNG